MKRLQVLSLTLTGFALTGAMLGALPSSAQHEGHGTPERTPKPQEQSIEHQLTQPNVMPKPGWPKPVMDDARYSLLLFDQLEYRPLSASFHWDMTGWWGGDYNRLWIKSEGGTGSTHTEGEVELQTLYGRLMTSFFDAQAGLRYDRAWRPGGPSSRVLAVLGLQGLAPFLYEVEPALFLSQLGDLSARFSASRSLLLTQRTFLQARIETNAALQAVPAFGIGSGLNDLSLGLRLRHEWRRELAPYLGVTWTQRFAGTADLSRQAGEPVSEVSLVTGVRWWY